MRFNKLSESAKKKAKVVLIDMIRANNIPSELEFDKGGNFIVWNIDKIRDSRNK